MAPLPPPPFADKDDARGRHQGGDAGSDPPSPLFPLPLPLPLAKEEEPEPPAGARGGSDDEKGQATVEEVGGGPTMRGENKGGGCGGWCGRAGVGAKWCDDSRGTGSGRVPSLRRTSHEVSRQPLPLTSTAPRGVHSKEPGQLADNSSAVADEIWTRPGAPVDSTATRKKREWGDEQQRTKVATRQERTPARNVD